MYTICVDRIIQRTEIEAFLSESPSSKDKLYFQG